MPSTRISHEKPMKSAFLPATVVAIVFPLYAVFGDAAYSLVIGLIIGALLALHFFDLIGLNSAVVIGVAMVVSYLLMGRDAFYLFGLLFGVLFCLLGLYVLFELFQPPEYRSMVIILLAISAPVALGIGGYLVWIGISELGLLPVFGIEGSNNPNAFGGWSRAVLSIK